MSYDDDDADLMFCMRGRVDTNDDDDRDNGDDDNNDNDNDNGNENDNDNRNQFQGSRGGGETGERGAPAGHKISIINMNRI